MRLLFSYILTLSLALAPAAQAQKCSSIMISTPASSTFSPGEKWSALPPHQQFLKLLVMLGSTNVPKMTEKNLIEKGEMSLGLPLNDGKTLLLEYALDTRLAQPIFRLARIHILNKFGQVDVLSKNPLDPETGSLRQIQDTDLAKQMADMTFPLTVEGELYGQLRKSIKWLENVTPSDLRKHAEAHILRLKIKGNWERFKAFVIRDLAKQVFRNLFFGGVVFISGTMAINTTMPSFSTKSVKTIESVIEKKQLKAMTDMILETKQMDPQEKAWLMAQIARETDRLLSTKGVNLKGENTQIRSGDFTEQIWLLNRVENNGLIVERIFLTTLVIVPHGTDARVTTNVLIEIPLEKMPLTYQTVKQLF